MKQPIKWDETLIVQDRVQELLRTGLASGEDEAFDIAITDTDTMQWEFEDFLEQLSQILSVISPKGRFDVEGHNLGWRKLNGRALVEACSAESFIQRVFPKSCEWSLKGDFDSDERTLYFLLFHHDAPSGETYCVRPAA